MYGESVLTLQRSGVFRGAAGFNGAAELVKLQQTLSNLSAFTQKGEYNPMRTDGVMDNQTLAATLRAGLNLNVPIVKQILGPLKSISLPIIGNLADALTSASGIYAVSQIPQVAGYID